jgi:FixJ family two-component response regulator
MAHRGLRRSCSTCSGQSGFEVLSALRIVPGWAEIPVVVLSGTSDYTAEHPGAAVLLQKPFASQALAAAVEAAIASKSASRAFLITPSCPNKR